jgi:hypothetical protein
MSASVGERRDNRNIELGSAVNWRPVLAAAGLGLVVVIAGVVVLLTAKPAPRQEEPEWMKPRATVVWNTNPRVPVPYEPAEPLPASTPHVEPVKPATARPLEREPIVRAMPPAPEPAAPAPVAVVAAPTPRPTPPVKQAEPPPEPAFKRRHGYNVDLLREQLMADARIVDIEAEKGASAKLVLPQQRGAQESRRLSGASTDKEAPPPKSAPIVEVIAQRADLKGLPVRNVADCQVKKVDALAIEALSRQLREVGPSGRARIRSSEARPNEDIYRQTELVNLLKSTGSRNTWSSDRNVRTLVQILQIESAPVRFNLVQMMAATKGKVAGAALAQSAVFDLSSDVREAAVEALRSRPSEEYRPILLAALRYPWSRVADHAAEALVALKDQEVVWNLVAMLDEPDPQAPGVNKNRKWVKSELVKVNHLGNCLLCHAASADFGDPIRALVPVRGEPLPVVYYDRGRGDFIRADVTYLKQDFSTVLDVSDAGEWPRVQRFDFMIRKRELTADEVAELKKSGPSKAKTYPQRDAVLWTLRQLTGHDYGERSEDWYDNLRDYWLKPGL